MPCLAIERFAVLITLIIFLIVCLLSFYKGVISEFAKWAFFFFFFFGHIQWLVASPGPWPGMEPRASEQSPNHWTKSPSLKPFASGVLQSHSNMIREDEFFFILL